MCLTLYTVLNQQWEGEGTLRYLHIVLNQRWGWRLGNFEVFYPKYSFQLNGREDGCRANTNQPTYVPS